MSTFKELILEFGSDPNELRKRIPNSKGHYSASELDGSDFIGVLMPNAETGTHFPDFALLQVLFYAYAKEEIAVADAHFERRLKELWELQQEGKYLPPLKKFVKQRMAKDDGVWVVNREPKGGGELLRILNHDEYMTVFTSRMYPLISHGESRIFQKAKSVNLGVSSASWIPPLLTQSGVEGQVMVEPDQSSLSNLNRLYGTKFWDLDDPKVRSIGSHVMGLNPYTDLTIYNKILSDSELTELVTNLASYMQEDPERKLILVEAIDAEQKPYIHQLAERLLQEFGSSIISFTPNNFADHPSLIIDSITEPAFFKNLTQEDVEIWQDKKRTLREKVALIPKVVREEHLTPRAMIGLMLFAAGKISYLTQHGPGAAASGAQSVLAVHSMLQGMQPPTATMLRPPLPPAEQLIHNDIKLLRELEADYPDLFLDHPRAPFATLTDAIRALAYPNYDWDYTK